MRAYQALLLTSLLMGMVRAFYIPGVAPTEYSKGQKLDIRVTIYLFKKYA